MVAVRSKTLVGQSSVSVRYVLYALIILVSTLFSFTSYRVFAPVKECIFLCGASLLCFLDRSWLIEQFKNIPKNMGNSMLALLAFYLAVSSFWGSSFPVALINAMKISVWFCFYLIVRHQFIYEDDMIMLLNVLAISLAANLVAAVAQLLGVYLPPELQMLSGPIGLIGNSNWLAIYISLLLLPEIWFLTNRSGRFRTVLAGFNVAAGLYVLYSTHCRGAWAAFAATIFMWAIMRHWGNDVARLKRKIGGFLVGGCLLILVLMLLTVYAPSILLNLWGGKKQQNVECRIMAYSITWDAVKKAPVFGHGLSTFSNAYPRMQGEVFSGFPKERHGRKWLLARPFRHVHNDFLELAYESGLVGILICLFAGYYVVSRFFFFAQRIPEGRGRQLSHLFFSLSVGFIVNSMSSFPFHQTTSALIFVIALGGLSYEFGGGRRELEPSGTVATGVFLIGSLTIVSLSLCLYISDLSAGRAYTLLKRGEIDKACEAATSAVGMNPWNGRAISLLARCKSLRKDYASARELFEKAAIYHYDNTCSFNLAVLALKEKDYALAEELFTRSLRECPSPKGFVALGDVLRMKLNYDEAEHMYKMALEMNRGFGEAGHKLARLYLRQGRMKDAVTILIDNINVYEARAAGACFEDGLVDVTNSVYLVKDLKLLKKIALRSDDTVAGAFADKRLKEMENK